MSEPRLDRIAIVMMSAVGDAVHVLPVIHALKRHAPKSRITWFLEPLPATLVRGHPAVDEIIEFTARSGVRAWVDLRRTLRNREFDVALDLQVAIKAGLVTAMVDAPVKIGFDRNRARDLNWLFTNARIPPRAGQHVQDQYFEFLDYLGVPHDTVEWTLGPWAHERAWAREILPRTERPLAAVVVATSKPEKDWPAERWSEVIDALYERFGLQPILVGGRSPRELQAEEIIMARARVQPVSLLGSGLRRLVTILDASALVLSPDTAPLHMAVALGKPVISLMGASDPKRTGPYRTSQDLVIDAYRVAGDDPAEALNVRRPSRMEHIFPADVIAKIELCNPSIR